MKFHDIIKQDDKIKRELFKEELKAFQKTYLECGEITCDIEDGNQSVIVTHYYPFDWIKETHESFCGIFGLKLVCCERKEWWEKNPTIDMNQKITWMYVDEKDKDYLELKFEDVKL